MRILFLHEVNYLKKPIFEMHEFPEYLAERGHEVGFVQFPEGEPKESLSKIPWKQKIQGRVVKDCQITLYTPKTVSTSTLGRMRAALTFSKAFSRILEDFKPDVVVSFSVPTSGWQALRTCKKANIPYLFRALDVSHKIRKSAFSPLILAAERFIYSNSDWVSANNPAMLDYCLSMGRSSGSSSVDLPPLDVNHFLQGGDVRLEYRKRLGLDGAVTIFLYMGSFFYFSGLPELIRSFSKESQSGQYLVLVGGGEQEIELRDLVSRLSLSDRVLFTGFVSFTDLPGYLSVADVALNPMRPSLVSNSAFPNKIIQYLAAALPVVSTRLKGVEATFPPATSMELVDSPEEVFQAGLRLLARANREDLAQDARTLVKSIFDAKSAVNTFEGRLLEIIRGSHND